MTFIDIVLKEGVNAQDLIDQFESNGWPQTIGKTKNGVFLFRWTIFTKLKRRLLERLRAFGLYIHDLDP